MNPKLKKSWWCEYCDMKQSIECSKCKPPYKEGKKIIAPSEWMEP